MRPRPAVGALVLMTVAVLAGVVAGCGAGGSTLADPTATNATAAQAHAVQTAIDHFNATAGGPVAAQQSVLLGLISAGQSTAQSRCPAVTVTISMQPVYARLAPSPGWRPATGSLPGTVYAVPTLLRIYTGDRITGTDLTDLHLAIADGRVTFPAICLR